MERPNLYFYDIAPQVLDMHLREWLARDYPGHALPDSVSFAESMERAPLEADARRIALFGHGAWALLEREGEPFLLAGMAACKFAEHHPGFFTLEYDSQGFVLGAGFWKRADTNGWTRCEKDDLPRMFRP